MYRATSSCMRLGQSIIYNFYKGTMGFVITWQGLWMLVGSVFAMHMVSSGLGRGQGGLISSNLGVYRHLLLTYDLVDQHGFKAHQVACSSAA